MKPKRKKGWPKKVRIEATAKGDETIYTRACRNGRHVAEWNSFDNEAGPWQDVQSISSSTMAIIFKVCKPAIERHLWRASHLTGGPFKSYQDMPAVPLPAPIGTSTALAAPERWE